jgi:hypothetical protein
LIFKVSRKALDYIYHEAKRAEECGMNNKKCGCVLRKTYGLPCACVLARKIHNKLHIRLDEVNGHWKKLVIEDPEIRENKMIEKCFYMFVTSLLKFIS